jgi:outer membrane protein assembly factor BamD
MTLFATPDVRQPAWRILLFAFAACGLMLLAACSKDAGRLTRLAPDTLYERASKSMKSSDYGEAIRLYEALAARYPFTDQARQARLDIIYAYYKNKETESATDAAETFIRENPAHPRVDYAWYLKGLIEFERTPYAFERWMGVDLSQRPPTTARKSFEAFKVVVDRYPKSAYAADARRRMIYLRNRLADYEIQIARYYLTRGAWVAAAQRAEQCIEQYDGAPSIRVAMRIMIDSYRRLGYEELAANTEKVYKENFPHDDTSELGKKQWWKFWNRSWMPFSADSRS